jgi:hypothetical protein
LALAVRIVTTFPRGDKTPASILWEGVVEVQNPDKVVPEGQPGGGYPERVVKGQMKLVRGKNGTFIGTPSRKTADGRYFNYYDLGPGLQRLIVPVLEAEVAVDPAAPAEAESMVETAKDEFSDLAF